MRARPMVLALAGAAAVTALGCPTLRPPPARPQAASQAVPKTAEGLLAAATVFSSVRHEFILDPTSSFAPGRGLQKKDNGLWEAVPTECARTKPRPAPKVDPETIDFGFVGVAVDSSLVGLDADLTKFFGVGFEVSTRTLRLVAIAFARELDPQFFEASDDVAYADGSCACARATHFVGAVKLGAMLSYETTAAAAEVHGNAFDYFKAKLALKDGTVKERRVGRLEIDDLEKLDEDSKHPPTFHVKDAVPLAYSVYPISDVCRFALPAPDVAPALVDFGEVPYGAESTRLVHVQNRAAIDLLAIHEGRNFAVPARGSVDVPISWRPRGEATFCESQTREETLLFVPRDDGVAVVPAQQAVRVVEHVHAGKPVLRQVERVDTGDHRKPDYAKTARDTKCPADYAPRACTIENARCADKGGACAGEGYAVTAKLEGAGCHFACTGPEALLTSQFCRFDAVTECALRCAK
jgi:hypothetical protein